MNAGAKRALCALGVLLLIAAGHGYRALQGQTPFATQTPVHTGLWEEPQGEREDVRVRIDGCVAAPGIYRVPAGTTVGQLIDAYAGGAKEGADMLALDLRQVLRDGASVYVP